MPVSKSPSWLHEALSSVVESSFNASAESCDEVTLSALAAEEGSWLRASVRFDGRMSGEVVCTLPESLVSKLAAAFGGLDPGDPLDPLLLDDLMGEFANMVCGRWLTRISDTTTFDLGAPLVSRPGVTAPGAANQMATIVNGQPAFIQVIVTRW